MAKKNTAPKSAAQTTAAFADAVVKGDLAKAEELAGQIAPDGSVVPEPTIAKLTKEQRAEAREAKKAARKAALAAMTPEERKEERAARRARIDAKAPALLLQRLVKTSKLLAKASDMVAHVTADSEAGVAVESMVKTRSALDAAMEEFTALVHDGWTIPAGARKVSAKCTVDTGTKMTVKPKAREAFEGILTAEEMDALVVVKQVKGIVFCQSIAGDRLMISRSKLNFA